MKKTLEELNAEGEKVIEEIKSNFLRRIEEKRKLREANKILDKSPKRGWKTLFKKEVEK